MKDFRMYFIHLCDDALFSQDGKLSLIGIFDVINLVSLPGSLLRAFLVFNMSILNEELRKVDLDIAMIKSDTKEEVFKLPRLSLSIASSLKDIDGGAKLGITLQLTSISFKETGKYILQVKANNIIVGSLDFMVNLLKEKKGKQINMPYRIVVSDYLYPSWYQYSQVETQKPLNEEYKMLGTFSQGTNWEKVFALGNEINKDLQITEQEIIDEVADFQK